MTKVDDDIVRFHVLCKCVIVCIYSDTSHILDLVYLLLSGVNKASVMSDLYQAK